jgi:hypothetical protein
MDPTIDAAGATARAKLGSGTAIAIARTSMDDSSGAWTK